jgi:hypothetical protein
MIRLGSACLAVAFGVAFHSTARAQGEVDFGTYVALGEGSTAGFQDGALHEAAQRKTYPTYVAAAAGTTIVLPLIAEPGFPPNNASR